MTSIPSRHSRSIPFERHLVPCAFDRRRGEALVRRASVRMTGLARQDGRRPCWSSTSWPAKGVTAKTAATSIRWPMRRLHEPFGGMVPRPGHRRRGGPRQALGRALAANASWGRARVLDSAPHDSNALNSADAGVCRRRASGGRDSGQRPPTRRSCPLGASGAGA